MPKYLIIEKGVGETPLDALESFRKHHDAYQKISLTYAGRLDPMASGRLLVLCGEECKNRSAYDSLDKEYEFEVLFGVSTDTGDVLGMPEAVAESQRYSLKKLSVIARALEGEHRVSYPAYSSKTVGGIPLFEYAKKGALASIEVPTTSMNIYRLRCINVRTVQAETLLERILDKIVLLQSKEFRSDEIGKKWSDVLSRGEKQYVIARFVAIVGSGTYIRTLAPMIAQRAGTDGIAYSIHRSRIGRYVSLFGGFGVWRSQF